jgi:hypothetical protein
MSEDRPKGHADLKELAASLRRRLDSLHALHPDSDPYLADGPSRLQAADWFAEIFRRLVKQSRIHVRAIFYMLVSQVNPARPDGRPFENTVDCSSELVNASRDARYLDLIPADSIIDRKHPEPRINWADGGDDVDAEVTVYDGDVERHDFGAGYEPPTISWPWIGLEEPKRSQAYCLEIWIEKSTANDVLLPLGTQFGVNIATFVGEVSATACKNLVDRAIASGKPVRILHITDFDPAGASMPVAAARKIEFWLDKSGHDLDIKHEHVALTHEQCIRFNLPRTPIKGTETRGDKFEERFGEGGTELDALQALHPGALREILIEHIERYFDANLESELDAAIAIFRAEIDAADSAVDDEHDEDIRRVEAEREAILRAFGEVHDPAREAYRRVVDEAARVYDEAIEAARDRIMEMEEAFAARTQEVLDAMAEDLAEAAPVPDEFDWPEAAEADEWEDPLYDSARSYLEQVDRFRRAKGKGDGGLSRNRVVIKICPAPDCGKTFESTNAKQRFCSKRCGRLTLQKARHACEDKKTGP